MKKAWVTAVVGVGVLLQGYAQVEERAEMAFSELESGTAMAAIEESVSVKDMVDDFLGRKGWDEGENSKSDGSSFIVATGTGIIKAPRGHHDFIGARQIAFDKAVANAKSSMLRFLSSEVETKMSNAMQQGAFPSPDTPPEKLTIWEKALLLVHVELDEKLKEKGIAPETPEADEILEGVLNEETFKQTVSSTSQSYMAGYQAYKTFESSPKGKQGRMGVVLLWSPKLNEMASAIGTGQSVPVGKPSRSLREQVRVDKKVLLSTFGVQQTRDENGNYWLLATGQAGVKSDSAMSEDMAEEQARLIAEAYIRSFAGENAKRSSDLDRAESTKELITGAEVYTSEDASKKSFETASKRMKIQGMKKLRGWQIKHPLTGQEVVGVVVAWSPLSAQSAVATTQTMKDARSDKKPKSISTTKENNFDGSGGFGGDEDDF